MYSVGKIYIRTPPSPPPLTRTVSPPPLAVEISTPREIIVTFPHPPLFSHHGYCLGVEVKPSTLLLWGPAPPLPGVLILFLVDTRS